MSEANKQLLQAINLAFNVHVDQVDKAGLPYILHPLHVMDVVEGIDAKIVAVLHDVVEDTEMTLQDLKYFLSFNNQFPADHLIDAIDAISHRKGEKNTDYWSRVKVNPLALTVKLADIAHNSSEARLAALSPEEAEYLRKKYRKALGFLNA